MTRLYSLEVHSSLVQVPIAHAKLEGYLSIPDGARSAIIFAQGRGSARQNAIDTVLATHYQHSGIATLLLDLYTPAELDEDMQDAHLRFNTDMLGQRLTAAADWMVHSTTTRQLGLGVMAASTGGAAAMIAAAARPEAISAVACRAGRPDLAGQMLKYIQTPTLFLVGQNDPVVAKFNEAALDQMPSGFGRIVTLPGVGHEFTETGALETLASITTDWFGEKLPQNRAI
jgi:dienelactone hydrolase